MNIQRVGITALQTHLIQCCAENNLLKHDDLSVTIIKHFTYIKNKVN